MKGSLSLCLLIALVASSLFAFGLLMMKSRAWKLPQAHGANTLRAIVAWIRDPVWSAGLLVQALGYALFVVALAGAPISMVSVMMQGGIGLFVLFAVVFLGERARPTEWAGIAITILGMVVLGLSVSVEEAQAPAGSLTMVLASAFLLAIGFIPMQLRRFRQNGVGAAILSGVIFGLATIYTKAMADAYVADVQLRWMVRIAANPYVYGVIVTNIVGMVALQNSFSASRGIIAMPLSSALSNIVPIASGMIVFGERLPADPAHATMRIAAFVLTITGSVLLSNAQEAMAAQVIEAQTTADCG
jgi:drug/metabolite transporter (DMT)-like permease